MRLFGSSEPSEKSFNSGLCQVSQLGGIDAGGKAGDKARCHLGKTHPNDDGSPVDPCIQQECTEPLSGQYAGEHGYAVKQQEHEAARGQQL